MLFERQTKILSGDMIKWRLLVNVLQMKKMYLRWNDNILSFIRENTRVFSKYSGVHGTMENSAQL